MTDPMESLKGLQKALNENSVQLSPCGIHSDLQVLLDKPNGNLRFTYAKLVGRKVHAVVLLVMSDPVDGVPCFQIGYAVSQPMRRKGMGTKILQQSLDELKNGLNGKMAEYWLEAIVGVDNEPSNQIAKNLISGTAIRVTDEFSGEPAYQYLAKVSLAPILKRESGVKH